MEVSGQFHAATTLPFLERTLCSVSIEQEAGWEDGWALEALWVLRRRADFMPLLGIKTPFLVCPAHCLVTVLTELFWLQK